jgi:hypothetical protein
MGPSIASETPAHHAHGIKAESQVSAWTAQDEFFADIARTITSTSAKNRDQRWTGFDLRETDPELYQPVISSPVSLFSHISLHPTIGSLLLFPKHFFW